jgi:hypothetical protein
MIFPASITENKGHDVAWLISFNLGLPRPAERNKEYDILNIPAAIFNFWIHVNNIRPIYEADDL